MRKKKVDSRLTKSTKHGCFSGSSYLKLTPTEKEVLFLLTHEFLTPKQISIRRHCTKQSIHKHIHNLKQKGAINLTNSPNETMVDFSLPTSQPFIKESQPKKPPSTNFIRLHGQEFNIKILWQDYKYKQLTAKANRIMIDGNTIRLYKNTIEIYSGQSFYADDTQKATARSMEYWTNFFPRLEHDLKIILTKPRSQNIRLVNQHYAETNNELARECEKVGDKIRVYTTDDGKLWFITDNSFNLQEAETLHPSTAKEDMQDTIRPFFNDMRDKTHFLPSEIKHSLNAHAETIQTILDVVKEITTTQLNQTKMMEALLPQPIKEKPIKQERPIYVG